MYNIYKSNSSFRFEIKPLQWQLKNMTWISLEERGWLASKIAGWVNFLRCEWYVGWAGKESTVHDR